MGLFARSPVARFAPPAAGMLLALLVRALPHPTVVTADGVFPAGPDAYYHLRRIAYGVLEFPRFLGFDPYVDFPQGGRPIWPPAFDFALAACARLLLGPQAGEPLERLLVWAPPLLGAATLLALWWLAQRAFGAPVAALAALAFAILPAGFVYSQLGEIDHHAAVALAVTLVLGATLVLLEPPPARPQSRLAAALGLGAAWACALLLWPGCLLALVISGVGLGVRAVTSARLENAVALARSAALAHAFALACVAPFAWGAQWERWGDVSPVVLSRFQPLYLAAAAVSFGLFAEAVRRVRFARTPLRRTGLALAAAGLVLAVCLGLAPGLLAGAQDAWGWLAKREAFQAVVAESEPLLAGGQGIETRAAVLLLSRAVYVLPLLLVVLAAGARRRPDAAARLFVVAWTAAWLVASLGQKRFVNELSTAWALVLALCAVDAWQAVRRRLAGRRRAAAAAAFAAFAAMLWLLAPVASFYAPYFANVRRALAGEPVHLSGWQPAQRALTQLARWLGAHTPPTSGWSDPTQVPEYGVLGAWGDGHVLRYVAQRPVVQDNFGDDVGVRGFALAERYFAETSEAGALAIAESLRARYVVVRGGGSGHSQGYGARSQFARLHKLKGAQGSFAGDGAEVVRLPALAHHRLIFDAEAVWGPSDGSRPSYKVFEIVRGARIAGRAAPGAAVHAELRIAMGRRGRMIFASDATAAADGSYELVVPYANDVPGREIRPGKSYRVSSGGREVEVAVSDTAVREGARVEAPPLGG